MTTNDSHERNRRILVIDDNPAIHEDFHKVFARQSPAESALSSAESTLFGEAVREAVDTCFEIDSAYQGQEGLAKVQQALAAGRPYALAFVDVRMPPGWDGVETIGHLWKATPELQVVICTAYSDYSWEQIYHELGTSDSLVILKKPFDNVEVLQLAHALTKKWSLNRQARIRMEDLEAIVQQRTQELQATNVRLAREITERNQAEEALRLSEERFSKAFKASPIPMGILARQTGRFVDVNENFLALTGLRREEVLDHAATELELSDDPATCQRLFTELQTHGVVRDFAGRLRAVGGQLREVIMAAEVIELRGEPHVLVSWQDITERQRLESQLRQAQKMEGIGQLAAGVAHDFNNILTVIQGHVDLCLTTRTLETPVSDSLKQVGHAADRAAALTRQLLAFSRRQVIQPEVLRLHQVLERSSSMLRRLIGETIKLTFDCPADLPPVYADACSLEQVLMNLTVNARDAMPNGGGLAIRVEVRDLDADAVRRNPEASPGRHICLSVSDTGCGMDTEVRTRAFEPFFTTKGIGKGTGLGLSTVHGIVKQHDGWIELSSRRGNGTTFHVYLPVTDRNATPSRPAPVIEPTPGENETLLVVEDEPDLCQLVCSILEHSGYHVLQATNGLEALELWAAHRDSIRLLLTDMVMPEGLSGCELARRLQAESPELRVIYCSGYSADYQDSGLTLTEGVNFLQKPYSPQRLTDTVRAALNGSELARAA